MSHPSYFLGIDLGSSSVKTSLFDSDKGDTIDSITYPEKNIPKATIIGTTLTLFIYLFSSIAIFGIMNPSDIAVSNAPYADAIGIVLGDYGKIIIAIFAIISGVGCLNGWTLLQIEIPKNLSEKRLLGTFFSETNSNGVPYKGVIASTIIVCILIGINYSKDLSNLFTYLILTSTFCTLILYFFISLSEIIIVFQKKKNFSSNYKSLLSGITAFIFSIWMIVGVGYESIISGVILLSLSLPIYIYQKNYAKHK